MADKFEPQESAKSTYGRLENDRQPYVTRAEECAVLTIPSLFPKSSDDGGTDYPTPFQSVGARGLNNLASKLMLAMFPPNEAFFRFQMGLEEAQKLSAGGGEKTKIDAELAAMEKVVLKYFEGSGMRVTLFEALKQLVGAGNCLLFLPPNEGGIKLYRLSRYVVERDGLGNVLQTVAMDTLSRASLPEELRKASSASGDDNPNTPVVVYTHVYWDGTEWQSYQEIDEVKVAGTENSYPAGKSPWIPVRLSKIDGEHYGRGFVEEYKGDLQSLENLSKAIVQMAMIASKVLWLVNPNGITQVRRLNKATTGSYVAGREEDIKPLQLQKYSDMQVAKTTADGIEARLSYAFMLNSAVQRGGERVTAEEIRYVARELEDTLGGIYSILTQELQLPLIRRLTTQLMAQQAIPDLPDGLVEPTVITGVDALGRGYDLNRLVQFIQTVEGLGEQAWARLKINNLMARIGMSLGVDTTELIKTDEEVATEQQELRAQEVVQAGATSAATAVPPQIPQ
ncbi:phage tail protein [Pseudomonas sp. HMWF032]|uniref:portal protein n=1 Tax=Pseudomonas sp. HMWF032 TaxID=2056866 RepID=UPI000D34D831|nr:portal protein [Pseudomonas sp. HMWF032]PTS86440.1 phage tail protein [Pseudomonas sp. HMWF032]PTT81371.1 phage tail protein [Pseudomonas sp. HMWF010]